jgi:molybdopterin converting factor small subunit
MTVRVLFFSLLRDIAGTDEIALDCSPGDDVASLLADIYIRWPKLRDWDASLLVAVDQTYVKRDARLHANAEVAIMPPVQGG